jgi:hypothetical protein
MPGVYDRRMFRMANGGMMPPEGGMMSPEGGFAELEAAEFATPEQESEIYQAAEGLPPEVLEEADRGMQDLTQQLTMQQVSAAADSEAQRSIQNLGSAGDFRGIMNAVWDDDADIEAYRDRLAAVVGPEDAGRTPDSVLALVQPTLQLAEIDKGVGSLMQEELAEIGGMGGGITELATKSAVADAMAAETGALVDRVGGMSQGQGPMGMAPGQGGPPMDPEMMQAMMQGAGPMGQGMV